MDRTIAYIARMLASPPRGVQLQGGEQAVNGLVDAVDVHQSGVSRHLRMLNEAGFVQVRPEGARRLYSLRAEPFRELDAWVSQYRSLWELRLGRFAEALDRKQNARAARRREKTS